jgi:predicted MFS family arabinose efflux permease
MDGRLLVLALGMFALGTDSFVVAGVLPEIAHSFDVGIGAAGQMTTVYAVTLGLLAPVIAAPAAHRPRKQILLAGLGVFVLANLGTAIAPTFEIALVTRALAGLGAAMFFPTATGSAASIVPPEKRGFALSVVATGMTVSTALGAPIGTLIGGLGDWHWTMVFVAVLAVISGIGVATFLSHIPMPPAISLGKRLAPWPMRVSGWHWPRPSCSSPQPSRSTPTSPWSSVARSGAIRPCWRDCSWCGGRLEPSRISWPAG